MITDDYHVDISSIYQYYDYVLYCLSDYMHLIRVHCTLTNEGFIQLANYYMTVLEFLINNTGTHVLI